MVFHRYLGTFFVSNFICYDINMLREDDEQLTLQAMYSKQTGRILSRCLLLGLGRILHALQGEDGVHGLNRAGRRGAAGRGCRLGLAPGFNLESAPAGAGTGLALGGGCRRGRAGSLDFHVACPCLGACVNA